MSVKPGVVRTVLTTLGIACAALLATDALLHRDSHFPWEGWFGFYALYGFAACVLLVVLAKQLRRILMRDEDFYDR